MQEPVQAACRHSMPQALPVKARAASVWQSEQSSSERGALSFEKQKARYLKKIMDFSVEAKGFEPLGL
jgi:hypothetical protein